jgi:hypothetical protein
MPKYIEFEKLDKEHYALDHDSWYIVNKKAKANGDIEGAHLGMVVWFPRWKKYVFEPSVEYGIIFEETCLRDIADFIQRATFLLTVEQLKRATKKTDT